MNKQEHIHSVKDVFDCPECGKTYLEEAEKKLKPKILKEYKEHLKELENPSICVGCGEVVEEQTEECPTCHGRDARKIE